MRTLLMRTLELKDVFDGLHCRSCIFITIFLFFNRTRRFLIQNNNNSLYKNSHPVLKLENTKL